MFSFVRLVYLVVAVAALSVVLARFVGLSLLQSVLFAIPVCVGIGSLLTLWQMARQGARGDAKQQVVVMLVIELVFVPLASVAALVAYFIDPPA